MSTKNNKLEILRHSTAHVLAAAVLEMFPETKFGIGPAIENGFYYDFDLPRALIPEDLPLLEEKMRKIIKANYPFEQQEIDVKKASDLFKKAKQNYKVELIKDILKEKPLPPPPLSKGRAEVRSVTLYKTGHFVDLCLGPHIDSTGEINPDAFKLTKISGAYWKGSEKNKMLQRIYGTAWQTKEDLDEYLHMLEEAEKRDHRKIAKELDLFHIDEIVGLGLPLWHPKGAILWQIIEDFWHTEHLKNGYELVRSPHIGNRALWETSGHWGFYNESMYPPMEIGQTLKDSQEKQKTKTPEQFILKPMNCPFHIQIFNSNIHSYRELPFRWAECGTVYRFEKRGELSGLTRVRGFTQDDAHIICRADQVKEELEKVVNFILFIYKSFGFNISDINVYLSVRDPKNDKYAGTEKGWKFTEETLEKIAKEKKLNITKDIGGAVFYGPKLDFKVKDAIGREWQCSTLQFDFNMPERFKMSFINEKGEKERPYMLHRALFGSFERFIGVLIEHFAGAFPLWLSPIQIEIIPVSEKFLGYAEKIEKQLKENNIRVSLNRADETLGKKIREAQKQKINYMLIIGEKEQSSETIAVRERTKGDLGAMKTEEFLKKISQEIKDKI